MRTALIIPGDTGGHVEVRSVPDLSPSAGQVLVRVRASGLNRGEIGQVKALRTGTPAPIGVEFAGEVAAVGAGVSAWREGDRVMGHGRGGQAQYALADPRALMRVPPSLSWTEAASFPNVFITAHDAVVTNGQLRAGEGILVNAASSGIGLAAIQIASLLGAKPIIATTRSAAKIKKLLLYGADVAIDTSLQSQADAVMDATGNKGVDVIIDCVGGTVFEANLASLAVKGRLINIGRLGSSKAPFDMTQLWLKRLKLIGVTFRTRSEEERLACVEACARDLLEPLAAGKLRWPIERTWPLEQLADAHAYMERDQHFGKLVITVD
jgi:NADPH:quinone reductase-like Zn-dependent oxidoreductase